MISKRSICPGSLCWWVRPATAHHRPEDSLALRGELAAASISARPRGGIRDRRTVVRRLMIATEVQYHTVISPPTRSAGNSFPCLLHAVCRRPRGRCVLISLGRLPALLPLDSQATARCAVKGFGLSLKEYRLDHASHVTGESDARRFRACHKRSRRCRGSIADNLRPEDP